MKVRKVLRAIPVLMAGVAPIAAAAPELTFPVCPSSPNCVSSLATDSHFIAPLQYAGDATTAFARLREILGGRSDARVVAATDTTLQVEFKTRLGFVDDALFVLDAAAGVIQVRSAARTGWWDLGKNRRRLDEIRRQLPHSP